MNATETTAKPSVEAGALDHERWTRVDASHQIARTPASPDETATEAEAAVEAMLEVEEPTPEMIAAVAGLDLDSRREHLQLQVSQLAGHLRERLREVDRREATLNARVAQLESDLRTSRLWLREREMSFQDREHELKCQIEELQDRLGSRQQGAETVADHNELPAADAADLEARTAEVLEREHQIHLREDELRQRRFEFDRQAAALSHAQQVWQQQREQNEQHWRDQQQCEQRSLDEQRQQMLEEHQDSVAASQEQLRVAELLLNEHAEKLDSDRAALVAGRQAWDEQKSAQRRAIEELRAATESELADRRARLDARQEWIERQKAGLDQVRDEALQLHRQSLEMRLLAEQLWAQITGNLTPAEVTHAIAQLRLKLAEQYRLEEQQLGQQREALMQLSERIAQQHAELEQLRGGLRDWAAARQGEIERQAATLVERELTLDTQQAEFRSAEQRWHAERRKYEQQIRELVMQSHALPAAA